MYALCVATGGGASACSGKSVMVVMVVENLIAQCDDGRHRSLDLSQRNMLVVHRCEVGHDAIEISKGYANGKAGTFTGHHMPYTFVITRDGRIQQALAIGEYGPHALRFSFAGIGVCLIGDFRTKHPTNEQVVSLVELSKRFVGWLGGVAIWGHDELGQGSSTDPNKQCPGRNLDMREVRQAIKGQVRLDGVNSLTSLGVVF